MKKIIIGVAGAAVAYSAISWYGGYLGEQQLRLQLTKAQENYKSSGIDYELVSYQRGIFSSQFSLKLTTHQLVAPLKNFEMNFAGENYHGPVLWHSGFGLGLFDQKVLPSINLADDEANKTIKQLFGDSLGVIWTRASFDRSYVSNWSVQPIKLAQDNASFTMGASSLKAKGKLDSLDGDISLALGEMVIHSADQSQIQIAPLQGEINIKMLELGIPLANYQLSIADAKLTNAAGVSFSLANAKVQSIQTANNEQSVDSSLKFTFDKLTGPAVIDKGYFEVKVNQIQLAAIRSWHKAYNEAMTSVGDNADQQAVALAVMGLFGSELPKFLQKGLNLHINLGAEFMGGKPNAHWEVNYVGPVDGKTLADLTNAQEYLMLADSDLLVQAPATLLGALPMDQYVGSYVTQEGDDYVLKASLHQGALKVGTVDVPQEQLLAMAGAFVTGFQNSIAARSASPADDTAADASDEQDYESDEGYEAEGGAESSQDEEQDEAQ